MKAANLPPARAIPGKPDAPWPSAQAAARWPDRPALHCDGEVLTWARLEERVVRHVGRLRSKGVEPGTAIAVMGPNSVDWVVQALAIPRAGGVLLPLNTRLAEPEIRTQIEAAARAARNIPPEAHTILFTSGTTGRPKGAVLTWANHVASARACIAQLGLDCADRYLGCIPFFHIGGLNILYRMALVGGCVVLHPRFDPEAVLRAMREGGVTRVSLTSAMLRLVLDAASRAADRPAGRAAGRPGSRGDGRAILPESVRTILVGGEHADPALLERCPQARATYGLTEACSHVTIADPGDCHTAGRPLPGYQVRIVGSDRSILPTGTAGQIEVRGPAVMSGYIGEEPLSGERLGGERLGEELPGGWLATGDIGSFDDLGRLTVHARRDDLILSGGENIYPAEIEAVLGRHPAVAECAVVGVPDDRWGQAPVAIVVRIECASGGEAECGSEGEAEWAEADADGDQLEAFLRQYLGGFKVPRRWAFVEALPRTSSGKIDREVLRVLVGRI